MPDRIQLQWSALRTVARHYWGQTLFSGKKTDIIGISNSCNLMDCQVTKLLKFLKHWQRLLLYLKIRLDQTSIGKYNQKCSEWWVRYSYNIVRSFVATILTPKKPNQKAIESGQFVNWPKNHSFVFWTGNFRGKQKNKLKSFCGKGLVSCSLDDSLDSPHDYGPSFNVGMLECTENYGPNLLTRYWMRFTSLPLAAVLTIRVTGSLEHLLPTAHQNNPFRHRPCRNKQNVKAGLLRSWAIPGKTLDLLLPLIKNK